MDIPAAVNMKLSGSGVAAGGVVGVVGGVITFWDGEPPPTIGKYGGTDVPVSELDASSDEKAGNGSAMGNTIGRFSAMSGSGDGSSVMSSGCLTAIGA